MGSLEPAIQCPMCGLPHRTVPLRRGERAYCVRCGETVAYRPMLGRRADLAFALTSLILFVPAATLPLVTLSKFGNSRASHLINAVRGMWRHGMPGMATWILFCGIVAPLVLMLCVVAASVNFPGGAPLLPHIRHFVRRLQEWAMPEVQVLAVLVAFLKLGDLVDVSVGPGLWCYGASAGFMLLAWRSYTLGGGQDSAEVISV